MSALHYLPSAKFAVMLGAILLSGGLVMAAQLVTHPKPYVAELSADEQATQAAQAANWQQVLSDIEAQSGVKAPEGQSDDTVSSLLAAAQSPNLTTTIGRTLFVNLSNANSQGLGQDAPTQDQLIAQAAAQIKATVSSKIYATADLTVVAQTQTSLHAYGNGIIAAMLARPRVNPNDTYALIGYATDYQDAAKLKTFTQIAAEYRALANDLLKVPVPSTLAPLHLQFINDLESMSDTYADMQTVMTDPLRGLAGLKQYQTLVDEAARVFTNIGQTINKDGILFSKDEPGAAWSVLIST